jgi:hypothetical protein
MNRSEMKQNKAMCIYVLPGLTLELCRLTKSLEQSSGSVVLAGTWEEAGAEIEATKFSLHADLHRLRSRGISCLRREGVVPRQDPKPPSELPSDSRAPCIPAPSCSGRLVRPAREVCCWVGSPSVSKSQSTQILLLGITVDTQVRVMDYPQVHPK